MAEQSLIDRFLRGRQPLKGVSFSGATGVDISALGSAIIGSIVTAIAIGTTTIVDAFIAVPARLLGGIESFIAGQRGVIFAFVEPFLSAIESAFTTATLWLSTFGPLAFPVAIALVLVGYYALEFGLEEIER